MIVYSDPAEDGSDRGRGVPQGSVGTGQPPAARRHRLRLHRARRSADAGLGVDRRGAANRRRARPCRSPRSWRCRCRIATSSRFSRRWAARRRPTTGRAACRSPIDSAARRGSHVRIDMQTDVQPNFVVEGRHARHRTARRVGRARQPPRRVGVRRRRSVERHGVDDGADQRARPAGPRGRAAAPHAGLRQLGRRGGHADRVDRVGRAVRRRAARRRRSPTSTWTRRRRGRRSACRRWGRWRR